MKRQRDTPVSEFLRLNELMAEIPTDQRDWLVDQMRRCINGEPNVIDGTAPNPYEQQSKAA